MINPLDEAVKHYKEKYSPSFTVRAKYVPERQIAIYRGSEFLIKHDFLIARDNRKEQVLFFSHAERVPKTMNRRRNTSS
jgi:hypothetical protein